MYRYLYIVPWAHVRGAGDGRGAVLKEVVVGLGGCGLQNEFFKNEFAKRVFQNEFDRVTRVHQSVFSKWEDAPRV
jgi:hypothetical protein